MDIIRVILSKIGTPITFIRNKLLALFSKKETFTFAALPLKYKDADGAPIRAVAIIEE